MGWIGWGVWVVDLGNAFGVPGGGALRAASYLILGCTGATA